MPDRAWELRAACRGHDSDIWFPDPSDTAGIARAAAICATCPVTAECDDWAKRIHASYGVFAGRFRDYTTGTHAPQPCGTYAALRAHRKNGEHCEVCQTADRQRREARKARR